MHFIRSVTPFATANTFCTSCDVSRNSLGFSVEGRCFLIQRYFCPAYDFLAKADFNYRKSFLTLKLISFFLSLHFLRSAVLLRFNLTFESCFLHSFSEI